MCTTVDQIQDKLQPVIDIDELISENDMLHLNDGDSLNNQEHTEQKEVRSKQQLQPVHKPSWNGELSQKSENRCDYSGIYKCGR